MFDSEGYRQQGSFKVHVILNRTICLVYIYVYINYYFLMQKSEEFISELTLSGVSDIRNHLGDVLYTNFIS